MILRTLISQHDDVVRMNSLVEISPITTNSLVTIFLAICCATSHPSLKGRPNNKANGYMKTPKFGLDQNFLSSQNLEQLDR